MHSLFTLPSLAGAMEEGTRKLLSSLAPAITHVFLHSITRYISNDKTSMDMRPQKPWSTFLLLSCLLSTHDAHVTHTPQNTVRVCMCVIVVPLYLPDFPPFLSISPQSHGLDPFTSVCTALLPQLFFFPTFSRPAGPAPRSLLYP